MVFCIEAVIIMANSKKPEEAHQDRFSQIESEILSTVSANLRKLQVTTKWTQRDFAEEIGYAVSTVNSYLQGEKLPTTRALVMLTRSEELRRKGIHFVIDDLFNPAFDPDIESGDGASRQLSKINYNDHREYIGTYILYLYEQTETTNKEGGRNLRYGLINFCEKFSTTGEESFVATARFYRAEDREEVFKTKERIDSEVDRGLSRSELSDLLRDTLYVNDEQYTGTVTFSQSHVFVAIGSLVYSDQALLILPIPLKKGSKAYIGGLCTVATVTRGSYNVPAAQKAILSRYVIDRSKEEIGYYLKNLVFDSKTNIDTEELNSLCKKLYTQGDQSDPATQFLQESDKQAILDSRLRKLIKGYVEDALCIAVVSRDEDRRVYNLIKEFAK